MEKTKKYKNRLLLICWLIYTMAYMLRVNISALLPSLKSASGYTNSELGFVTGAFFVTYMTGQLISGYLGDRLPIKKMLIFGLSLSAAVNFACSFTVSAWQLAVLWGLNGFVQSTLWAPMMRLLSIYHQKDELPKVSFYMSLTSVVGYSAAWAFSYATAFYFSWRTAFIVPAVLIFVFCAIPMIFIKNPRDGSAPASGDESAPDSVAERVPLPGRWLLTLLPVYLLIPAAVSQGLIREGIGVWFPTIMTETGSFSASSDIIVLLIVPFINFLGILMVKRVYKGCGFDSTKTLCAVFLLSNFFALAAAVFAGISSALCLVATVLLLTQMSGLTPLMTSIIPFKYVSYGKVSFVAGGTDFLIYCGAALSSLLSSTIADGAGWRPVMLLWFSFSLLGTAASLLWRGFDKRQRKMQ